MEIPGDQLRASGQSSVYANSPSQILVAQIRTVPDGPTTCNCTCSTLHMLCLACRLLKSTKDYELRIYDVYPFATTPYERRDEGFLALGSYMEGRNSESARMNLTQPIVMRYEPATVSAQLSMLGVAGVF